MEDLEAYHHADNQKVVVRREVVRIHRKSPIRYLIGVIGFLLVMIFIGILLFGAIWIHTFKVYTQEKPVAELRVSKKIIRDGAPVFDVTYTPYEDVSGFWGIFGSKKKSKDKAVTSTLVGDQVFVDSDFVRWSNWMTFLNVKPVYKVSRLKGGFRKIEDYQRFSIGATDINGGPDDFVNTLQEYPESWKWLAQSVYISSGGVNVQDQERVYEIKITEDALVIEPKL